VAPVRGRIDGRYGKAPLAVIGLVALAMVQGGAIVYSATRTRATPATRPPDLVMGDTIRILPGRDSLSRITQVTLHRSNPPWTALLAFSPTCAWCDSVAPLWKRWTRDSDVRAHVVGVAWGDPSAAHRYAHDHEWRLAELLVVDSVVTGSLGRQLTRKTPWFFLLDSAGVVRYSGHGNEIGVVDSLVATRR
jgi:hypothetical protein